MAYKNGGVGWAPGKEQYAGRFSELNPSGRFSPGQYFGGGEFMAVSGNPNQSGWGDYVPPGYELVSWQPGARDPRLGADSLKFGGGTMLLRREANPAAQATPAPPPPPAQQTYTPTPAVTSPAVSNLPAPPAPTPPPAAVTAPPPMLPDLSPLTSQISELSQQLKAQQAEYARQLGVAQSGYQNQLASMQSTYGQQFQSMQDRYNQQDNMFNMRIQEMNNASKQQADAFNMRIQEMNNANNQDSWRMRAAQNAGSASADMVQTDQYAPPKGAEKLNRNYLTSGSTSNRGTGLAQMLINPMLGGMDNNPLMIGGVNL